MNENNRAKKPDMVVVIPTLMDRDLIVPCLRRLLLRTDGYDVQVILSENAEDADRTLHEVNPLLVATTEAAQAERKRRGFPEVRIPIGTTGLHTQTGGPAGFARAVNNGLEVMHTERLLPRIGVVILNDDCLVADGWLDGLVQALRTDTVILRGEDPGPDGRPVEHPLEDMGGFIGIAGPITNHAAGPQQRIHPQPGMADPDQIARQVRVKAGPPETVSYLSGFCLALSRKCYDDLIGWVPVQNTDIMRPILFCEEYGIGGYEDDDLMARAERKGWRSVLAPASFVMHLGHRTLDRVFPGQVRGLANAPLHLARWGIDGAQQTSLAIAGLVHFGSAQDLLYWRTHVRRASEVATSAAYVLLNSPADILNCPDYRAVAPAFRPEDTLLIEECIGAGPEKIKAAVRKWLAGRFVKGTWISVWDRPVVDERDARQMAVTIAESFGSAWILALDHDENLETRDRTEKMAPLFSRLLGTPDPMVLAYEVGIVNLWDSPRLQRTDPPWGDGGTYAGDSSEIRLWRVGKEPRKLAGGVGPDHAGCPPAPPHPPESVRIAGLRIHSYRHLRPEDRPDVEEEGMRVSPVLRANGIGFTMLCYAGEAPHDLARWLGMASPLCDHIAIVWTGTEKEIPTAHSRVLAAYRAEVVWHDMQASRSYAEARNAGLDALREAGCSWAWIADPDEHWQDPYQIGRAIRRMAEATDSFGWNFRFANVRQGGEAGYSETVRMVRLDPEKSMVYTGRVHETFDEALGRLAHAGIKPNIRTAPFALQNAGLAADPVATERKLLRYAWLLAEDLEERPGNSAGWVSLGLQYEMLGRMADAAECYRRAVLVCGMGHLGPKEMAAFYLRQARAMTQRAVGLIAEGHPVRRALEGQLGWLEQHAPAVPVMGLMAVGDGQPDQFPPLPSWPAESPKPIL